LLAAHKLLQSTWYIDVCPGWVLPAILCLSCTLIQYLLIISSLSPVSKFVNTSRTRHHMNEDEGYWCIYITLADRKILIGGNWKYLWLVTSLCMMGFGVWRKLKIFFFALRETSSKSCMVWNSFLCWNYYEALSLRIINVSIRNQWVYHARKWWIYVAEIIFDILGKQLWQKKEYLSKRAPGPEAWDSSKRFEYYLIGNLMLL